MRHLKGFFIVVLSVLFLSSFANTQTSRDETLNVDEFERLLKPLINSDTDVPTPLYKGSQPYFENGKLYCWQNGYKYYWDVNFHLWIRDK